MMMVYCYGVYLVVCFAVTIWVARMLRKDAPALIESANEGQTEANGAITRLMIVGFYLVNIGAICVALRYGGTATDVATALELLSTKIGIILVALGLVHFSILAKLFKIKHDSTRAPLGQRLDVEPGY